MKYLFIALSLLLFFSNSYATIDLQELEKQLSTTGLKGEIHGSVSESNLYVLSYRNPQNFFDNIQLPLTSESEVILKHLPSLKRHQFYLVKGNFVKNKAPIKHINITSLELIKDYSSQLDKMPYAYKGDLNDLNKKSEYVARVHAIGQAGKMLVTEYKDRIIPIFVTEASSQEIVKQLYRGDLVRVRYIIRTDPEAPIHLSLVHSQGLSDNQKPIEVLESLVKCHGITIQKSGSLIMFPKSPQINTNIYALLVEDSEGTTIQYTLANLENPELFKQIREKLEKIWEENTANVENDRNKLVNKKLKVTAKGICNMVDPGQANPQILIQSVDDVNVSIQ